MIVFTLHASKYKVHEVHQRHKLHQRYICLWWSLCALYLHACQVRVTVGDLGLCCYTCYVFQALINSLVC